VTEISTGQESKFLQRRRESRSRPFPLRTESTRTHRHERKIFSKSETGRGDLSTERRRFYFSRRGAQTRAHARARKAQNFHDRQSLLILALKSRDLEAKAQARRRAPPLRKSKGSAREGHGPAAADRGNAAEAQGKIFQN
jgi:hypothetical protein